MAQFFVQKAFFSSANMEETMYVKENLRLVVQIL